MNQQKGGLDLTDCQGAFRHKVDMALKAISAARLPDGRRPFCSEAIDIVKTAKHFRTYVLFDVLPPYLNQAEPVVRHGETVGYDVKISATSIEGILGFYPDGAPKTLETLLAHELCHAARFIRRTVYPTQIVEEVYVTSLENEYRYARGISPQRKSYDGHGEVPVKTYPW